MVLNASVDQIRTCSILQIVYAYSILMNFMDD